MFSRIFQFEFTDIFELKLSSIKCSTYTYDLRGYVIMLTLMHLRCYFRWKLTIGRIDDAGQCSTRRKWYFSSSRFFNSSIINVYHVLRVRTQTGNDLWYFYTNTRSVEVGVLRTGLDCIFEIAISMPLWRHNLKTNTL